MAFCLPFGTHVNQMVGRYVAGYPSDRIKDVMIGVERKICVSIGSEADLFDVFVHWSEIRGPGRNMEICLVRLLLCADCPSHDLSNFA